MYIILGSLVAMILMVIVIKLIFSDSDEIPNTNPLPTLKKKPVVESGSSQFQPHSSNAFSNNTYNHNNEQLPELQNPQLREDELASSDKLNTQVTSKSYRYHYVQSFEEMWDQPEVVTFDELLNKYWFGFHQHGKMHYCICCVIYPFIFLFRIVLLIVECLGYIFFHVLIRFIFEVIIRSIGFIIQVLIRGIGHLFDGV